MDDKKPFDVLVIRSPWEYALQYSAKEPSLERIAQLCETHQIPVRVSDATQSEIEEKIC